MKQLILSLFFSLLMATASPAHLCNDVFIQAKDNLAVKVDIRDNQLRINSSASFRVYLLNTMDRDIANIALAVDTDDFDVEVKPATDWANFPVLTTKTKGGKKEYFEVNLNRKKDTAQGKYKIGLRLFNGEDKSMVFKTMDINEAIVDMDVPKIASTVKIDGNAEKSEWENSLLCSSFYEYKNEPVNIIWFKTQLVNKVSDIQTRCRFSHDDENLYCMIDFQTQKKEDIANIYISQNQESSPVVISVNLQQQKAFLENNDNKQLNIKFSGTKAELQIPFEMIGGKKMKSFYVNVTRKQNKTQTYWRGNEISIMDPVVYANFILK